MELIWHGHATWQVTVGGTTLLIDPFFDNPVTGVDPADLDTPAYLLLTHAHSDHIADVDVFAADTTVVSTPEVVGWVDEQFDPADAIGMNIGGTVELGEAYVTMVHAYHTNGLDMAPDAGAGVPTGFVISDAPPSHDGNGDATAFYHAGDTSLTSEMKDVIGPFLQPDAAALPVGDHFTMGPGQAAIAVEWLGVEHAFPMHYGTFPQIDIDPEEFVDAVATRDSGAAVHVLGADEPFEL